MKERRKNELKRKSTFKRKQLLQTLEHLNMQIKVKYSIFEKMRELKNHINKSYPPCRIIVHYFQMFYFSFIIVCLAFLG